LLGGALLISGCSDLKKAMGLERTSPRRVRVESRRAADDAARFQSASAAARRCPAAREELRPTGPPSHRTGGPGEPGKQAPDFRLRRAEDGLPDIGARSGQAPDPNAAVGEQSLSSKLLDYQPSNGTSPRRVEKRETKPAEGGLLTDRHSSPLRRIAAREA